MFAQLVAFSVRNRVFVVVLSALLMAYGALVLTRLPVDVFPDLDKSVVTVMTEAEGLGTEETEQTARCPSGGSDQHAARPSAARSPGRDP